eukprot:m.865823 g.865823  ORF g.865823 m.865823 type:complete len:1554 (-) comp59720_c0_seq9:185-4846(-)
MQWSTRAGLLLAIPALYFIFQLAAESEDQWPLVPHTTLPPVEERRPDPRSGNLTAKAIARSHLRSILESAFFASTASFATRHCAESSRLVADWSQALDKDWVSLAVCFERRMAMTWLLVVVAGCLVAKVFLNYRYPAATRALPSSSLYRVKLALSAGLLLLEVLLLQATNPHISTSLQHISCIILVIALLVYEHTVLANPIPALVTLCWLLLGLAQLMRVGLHFSLDTLFGTDFDSRILLVQSALLGASLIASCLVEPLSRNPDSTAPSPELTANLFSLLSFDWLTSLLKLGYSRPLTEKDLFDARPGDDANYCTVTMHRSWEEEKLRAKSAISSEPSLFRATFHAFGWPVLLSAGLKFAADLLALAGPLSLNFLIGFLTDPHEPTWHGYAYAWFMLAAAILHSILMHQYFHFVLFAGMRMRTGIAGLVYSKSLRLTSASSHQTTLGNVLNHVTVDCQRLHPLMGYIHMTWSAPFQIFLAMLLLWQVVGMACLPGIAIMAALIPANTRISGRTKALNVDLSKQKDVRIKLMTQILSGIRVIKLYAWEKSFMAAIQKVREAELALLSKSSFLKAQSTLFASCAPFFVALATFVTYTMLGHDLTAATAFVSLSLFNLIQYPLSTIPQVSSMLVEAKVSMQRLHTFLLSPEVDHDAVSIIEDGDDTRSKLNPVVEISGATLAWREETEAAGPPTLRNINMSVLRGKLVAVVGTIGCGKSSLLSAVLGHMNKIHGRVSRIGNVAYVAQQAWIQNATLQDNVLFERAFDADVYAKVVHACALEADLQSLPAGDMTEIGEKGINLSGGQKQRVSLARAVYQDASLYLLDDPLSAVDSHVAKHLFDNVIGNSGLLKNKTRILVTHQLSILEEVDEIIVMKNGEIVEHGSYQSLIQDNRDFAKFLAEFATPISAPTLSNSTPARGFKRSISQLTSTPPVRIAVAPSSGEHASAHQIQKPQRSRASADSAGTLIKREEVEEGRVKWHVFQEYLAACGRATCIGVACSYLVTYGAQVATNVWLSIWSQRSDRDPEAVHANIHFYLIVYGVLGITSSIGILLTSIGSFFASQKASRVFHERMLNAVVHSPMLFFDTTPLGRVINRFARDVSVIDDNIPYTTQSFLSTTMQVVSTIVSIAIATPWVILPMVPIALIYIVVQAFYVAASRQLKRLDRTTRSPIYAHYGESYNGAATISAFARDAAFEIQNQGFHDVHNAAYYASVSANRWLALRLDFVGNLVSFVTAFFAIYQRDSLDPGLVGLALSYAMAVTKTLDWMVRHATVLETDSVSVESVYEYARLEVEAQGRPQQRAPRQWPASGSIAFETYSTRYRPGLDLVLKEVSVLIQPGEKIGIVGRTGAGKSSLTLALFRLIEAASGRIMIDGEDISLLSLEDLRSRITVLPQEAVLFQGTVRSNLDPFDSFSDLEIWRALEVSHLHAAVSQLQAGLSAFVSEGGENFSVGQRQLLCLARAVLRKTKILVLDEATAACDMETDSLIQQTIQSEFASATVLTIAHRLHTILASDRVLLMDQGRVAEFDSPKALLCNEQSIFAGLCHAAGVSGPS